MTAPTDVTAPGGDLTALLRAAAIARPHEEVLRYGDRTWTREQWDQRIDRVASALAAAGVGVGDRVAVLDRNHPSCVEVTLACARIGAVNAVINARLTAEEIAYILGDAAPVVLFVGPDLLPMIGERRAGLRAVVLVDGEPGAAEVAGAHDYDTWLAGADPAGAPAHQATSDAPFLQLYTSGTTGFPKGAMLTHGGMLAHGAAVGEYSGLDADTYAMVAMPLFHVGGSSWALAALQAGGRILVVRDPIPDALLAGLAEHRITHTFFVPALLAMMVRVPGVTEYDLSALRCLCYGASPMPLPLLRTCLDVFDVDFYQVYGMTEACGVVTELGPAEHRDLDRPQRLLSAGLPIPGVRIEIRDPATGEPVGPGEQGEVWVHTAQLMAGYWGRADESAAALPGGGWLRSGDAGHLDDEGYLYITDRIKDMIVSGGENVYPAEVERVFVEHPAVAEVAVVGVPDDRWGEVPLAIVVPAPGVEIAAEDLMEQAGSRLASFKRPRAVRFVAELPRNASGKVLKRELRAPFWADRERSI